MYARLSVLYTDLRSGIGITGVLVPSKRHPGSTHVAGDNSAHTRDTMVAADAVLVLRDLLTFALPPARILLLRRPPSCTQLPCQGERSTQGTRDSITRVIFPKMGRTPVCVDARVGVVLC